MLKAMADVKMIHVPYKAVAGDHRPARGEVALLFSTMPPAMPMVQSGNCARWALPRRSAPARHRRCRP